MDMARIDQTSNSLAVDTDVLFVNVSNNRVGINQSNPNTPLHVVGATTVDGDITSTSGTIKGVNLVVQAGGGGSLTFADGTSMSTAPSAPDLAGSIATGQVAFGASANTIAGNNNLFWDNANARLGLGTNSPSSSLHIIGVDDDNPEVRLQRTGVATQFLSMQNEDASGGFINSESGESNKKALYMQSVHNSGGSAAGDNLIIWRTGAASSPTERMRISDVNNLFTVQSTMDMNVESKLAVGKTSAPSYTLEVEGSSTQTGGFAELTGGMFSSSSGESAISNGMTGWWLTARGMNSNPSIYTPALKFGSTDTNFTTDSPKFLAGIVGRSVETYGADTDGGMALDFLTFPNNGGANGGPTTRMTIDEDGSLIFAGSFAQYNGAAPTDGQLLIGDTASGVFDAATLTAGANITITNAAGAITIAASGGGGGVSIGDAVGSGTSGSILFVDASTNLAQDNGELYWDNTNNRLGIGTTSPSAAIEVDAGASTEYAILSTGANGRVGLTTQYGGIHFNNVEATADLWQLSERDTANFDISFGTPDAGNNVSATNTILRITSGGNVGIGLGNTDPSQKLHVVGTIRQTNVTDAIVYADANGDLGALTVGSGLSLVGSTLTATGGGGGGSPGGANTQVQYNNGGAFGADGNFIYDSTAPALAVGFTAAGQSSGSISSDVMTAGNNIAVRYNQSGATAGTYGLTLSDANMSWPGAPVGSSTTIMPAIDLSAGNYDFATLNGAGNCSQTHYLMITVGSQGADAILMPDPGAVGIPPGSRWTICCLDNVGGMGNIEFGGQVVPACPPLAGVFTNVIISGIGSITLFTDGASWFVESDTVVQNRGRITIEYL
jgi:hypothetical protein